MLGLGPAELLVIIGIILLIFGPKKLPNIGRDLGAGIRSFINAGKEILPTEDTDTDNNKETSDGQGHKQIGKDSK